MRGSGAKNLSPAGSSWTTTPTGWVRFGGTGSLSPTGWVRFGGTGNLSHTGWVQTGGRFRVILNGAKGLSPAGSSWTPTPTGWVRFGGTGILSPTTLFHLKLYYWIKVFEFNTGIVNGKLPINTFLPGITIYVPGSELSIEFIQTGNSLA